MWNIFSLLHAFLTILLVAALRPVTSSAQFSRAAFTLTPKTLPSDRGPILLITREAGEAGWELHDAQVKDGLLTGTLSALHPQTVRDLMIPASPSYEFCVDHTCDLLYGLSARFVLVDVRAGGLDACADGAGLHLPLKAVRRAYTCKARIPAKSRSAYATSNR